MPKIQERLEYFKSVGAGEYYLKKMSGKFDFPLILEDVNYNLKQIPF